MEGQPSSDIQLPPGFRFYPSDEELIVHYLRNKATSHPIPASIIAEINLYKYNPWELPRKALFGEDEWYFFSPRDRKYPNGARPNRSAASGYWKATGTDKPILSSHGSQSIGVKKALVFYKGRPPKGMKTDWIMHEYRLPDQTIKPLKIRGSMRLDDWVLCRVRKKSNVPKGISEDRGSISVEPVGCFPQVEEQHSMNTNPNTLPKNISEDRGSISIEPVGCFPQVEEPCSMNTNPNTAMVANYLYNGCPLLACIFASQNDPDTETIPDISFQCSNKNNSCSSIYDNSSNKGNSPTAVSSFHSLFDPSKRKPAEGNQNENLPSYSSKKLTNNESKYDDLLYNERSTDDNNTTDINLCSQLESQGNIFNHNPLDPFLKFQELNQMTFTEQDFQ